MRRTDIPEDHTGMVWGIASDICKKIPASSSLSLEDLVQYGWIGYLKAVEKFDQVKYPDIPFKAYAAIRIRGAIIDGLRDMDIHSRRVRRKKRLLEKKSERMTQVLGRRPTFEELASETDTSVECVIAAFSPCFEESVDPHSEMWHMIPDPAAEKRNAFSLAEALHLAGMLDRALQMLKSVERYTVTEHFFENRFQADIAEDLGVTESRVCQILKEALIKLKKSFEEVQRAEELIASVRIERDTEQRIADDSEDHEFADFDRTSDALDQLLEEI